MRRSAVLLLALSTAASYLLAQNTAPQATPQTRQSAPASTGTPPATRRGSGGAGSAARGGPRRSSSAPRSQGTPAATGNESVGVIGDSNGDGLLDRSGGTSNAALPGIPMLHNAMGIATGTSIHVRLQQPVDSGHARNGDTIRAVLDAPLGKIAAGAPVTLTVVAAAAAGQLNSNGVLSLQVVSINGEQILSQVITAEGKEGQKELPDAAPARGTEAIFSPDEPITLPAA